MSRHPSLRSSHKAGAALLLVIAIASVAALLRAQDALSKFESQYQSQNDPVQRAKILAKLGPLTVAQAHKQMEGDQDEQALAELEQYRDRVRQAISALTSANIDPDKHPAGFKELQIGLRETIRRLDDFIVNVPVEKRPWFRAVRSDLLDLQNSLLDDLFPKPESRPGKKEKS